MNCPLCGKMHDVEERTRVAFLIIKGEEVRKSEQLSVNS